MRLGNVLPDLEGASAEYNVTGFAIDHRKVAPGSIFGAFQGERFNGEDYISDAITSGAVAVVARPNVKIVGAYHIAAENPRHEFARIAASFFRPIPEHIAAITGTNGKTSTVELARQLWRMAGCNAASIGTLGITTSGEQTKTGLTTPDIVTFLSNISGLACEGVTHVAFEASSHGLDQYRSEGIPVEVGAFTNLSRDHLDYHGDMDTYFEAKMRLFDEVVDDNGTAVIWADDAYSDRAIAHAKKRALRIITVGQNGEGITLLSRQPSQLGQDIELRVQGEVMKLKLPLIGAYQASNALMAAGVVIATGGIAEDVVGHMARLQPVRGRLERACISRSGAPVYVDYAHTPDALHAAITAMRPHSKGRIILVFGAGGDRDKGKRPEMGMIAVAEADVVIVTDDNPRSEDPSVIRSEILKGAAGAVEMGDRRSAILHAITIAQSDDIVLIAGKGHEQGQIIGERILPFDDVEVARECAA